MALDDTLKQAGVSDAAIQILHTQEFEQEEDLQLGFSYEQFIAMGIAAVSARKLADLYPVKTAVPAPAPAVLPPTIRVTTGDPRSMPLAELLAAIAGGERDPEYVSALRDRTRGRALFVRNDQGALDVQETLALIADTGDDTPPAFWGVYPTETIDQILLKQRFANPITGKALAKGDRWELVSVDRRKIAAYARIANLLPIPCDDEMIAREMQEEVLTGRAARWEQAYLAAAKRNDQWALQAQGAIYYQEGGARRPASPFVSASVATVARTHRGETDAVARMDRPAMPDFPPAVPEDFRTLTRLYVQGDKTGMEDFLYRRGLYLEMNDLEPRYIESVPFEALCLLRAGSSRSVFASANSGRLGWLEQAVGLRRAELLCQSDFYQALRQARPDPSDPLVLWCSAILFSERFSAGNTARPSPHGQQGNNWRGQRVVTYRQ